jgi:CheY-like chemotaxis protein
MLINTLRRTVVLSGVGSLIIGVWYLVPLIALMSGTVSGTGPTEKWIMVIEDNPDWQNILTHVLLKPGVRVTVDGSCTSALARISVAAKPFGAIVDGTLLNGESGLECILKIKEISPATQILFLPGSLDYENGRIATKNGANFLTDKGKFEIGETMRFFGLK